MIVSRSLLSLAIKKHCSSSYFNNVHLDEKELVKQYVSKRDKFIKLEPSKYSRIAQSPQEMAKVERVLMEWEIIKLDSGLVPSTITLMEMKQLIRSLDKCQDLSEKFFTLLEVEARTRVNLKKKEREHYRSESSAFDEPITLFDSDGYPVYSQSGQTHFPPFNLRHMNQMTLIPKLHELSKDSRFCQKLVIDCDNYHDDNLAARIISRSIMNAFWLNAYNDEPFDIHVCGVRKDSAFHEALKHCCRTDFTTGTHPLSTNIHPESLCKYYPPERLIYITPYGGEEIVSFDPAAVYVTSSFIPGRDISSRFLEKIQKTGWKSVHFPVFSSLKLLPHQFNLIEVVKIISEIKQGSSVEDAIKKFIFRKNLRLATSRQPLIVTLHQILETKNSKR
ncbi:uncharacterized protein LOC141850337 [Brevipalpus obovatus]|uniref:uncharacterized protein LOC141850337 n=1 Tax=Brevipalpus obovatus TaxID=246614 RepID=UPI003D9DEE33